LRERDREREKERETHRETERERERQRETDRERDRGRIDMDRERLRSSKPDPLSLLFPAGSPERQDGQGLCMWGGSGGLGVWGSPGQPGGSRASSSTTTSPRVRW